LVVRRHKAYLAATAAASGNTESYAGKGAIRYRW